MMRARKVAITAVMIMTMIIADMQPKVIILSTSPVMGTVAMVELMVMGTMRRIPMQTMRGTLTDTAMHSRSSADER